MRSIPLWALVTLISCVRWPNSSAVPEQQDPSIVFPEFYGSPSIIVGEHDKTYALDGVTLRALMVAANDFIPPGDGDRPCSETLEAHGFQVIRQGDIVFVAIHADHQRCGQPFLMLDAGAKYAISADGRILRRVFDSEPGTPAGSLSSDAGSGQLFQEPGLPTVLKPRGYDAAGDLPPWWRDGGSGLDGGSGDGGVSR